MRPGWDVKQKKNDIKNRPVPEPGDGAKGARVKSGFRANAAINRHRFVSEQVCR